MFFVLEVLLILAVLPFAVAGARLAWGAGVRVVSTTSRFLLAIFFLGLVVVGAVIVIGGPILLGYLLVTQKWTWQDTPSTVLLLVMYSTPLAYLVFKGQRSFRRFFAEARLEFVKHHLNLAWHGYEHACRMMPDDARPTDSVINALIDGYQHALAAIGGAVGLGNRRPRTIARLLVKRGLLSVVGADILAQDFGALLAYNEGDAARREQFASDWWRDGPCYQHAWTANLRMFIEEEAKPLIAKHLPPQRESVATETSALSQSA